MAAYLLGALDFDACLTLQQRLIFEAGGRQDGLISLLVCEHPLLITVGRQGSRTDIRLGEQAMAAERLNVRWVNRGGGTIVHAPGQVAVYPIVPLEAHGWTVGQYLRRLQNGLSATLTELGLQCQASPAGSPYGVWGRTGQVAALGVAVKNWTSYFGAYINVSPPRRLLSAVHTDSARRAPMTSLAIERQQPTQMSRVREALVRNLATALDSPRYNIHTGHSLTPSTRVA
jgi:lipoyl(octanoyl) transferase